MLDFQQIKAEHRIEDVAERLGLELTPRGDQLRGKCPSGEGGERALVITPKKQVWYSFGAKQGGDVLALVAFVNGSSVKDAAQFLAGNTPPEKKPEGTKPSEGFKPLEYLQAEHPAVQALGIDAMDAQRLGIGHAPRGVMRGMVCIPVRNEAGVLAGYIGIEDGKVPKEWHA